MLFPVRCTACGLENRLPEHSRGHQVRCTGCGATFLADPTVEEELPEVLPTAVAAPDGGSVTTLPRGPAPAPTRRAPRQVDSLWFDGGVRSLVWCPDRSGWVLFGHLLVDRPSGAVVWHLPPEPRGSQEIVPRLFLDADHVSTVEGQFEKKLSILTLPRAQIDAAVKAARAGK